MYNVHIIGLIRVNYHADVFKPGYTERQSASAPQHKKPVRTVRYPGVIFEDTIIKMITAVRGYEAHLL